MGQPAAKGFSSKEKSSLFRGRAEGVVNLSSRKNQQFFRAAVVDAAASCTFAVY